MRDCAILFAVLCWPSPALAQERGATTAQPTRFEIGRHTFIDVGPPFDYYELLIVRSAENGTSIERITLTPAGDVCFSPAKYEMADGSVTETIPALLGKTNPCKIPEKELRHELKRRKKGRVFSGAEVVMQVQCGNQTRIIRSDVLDRDMFNPAARIPQHTSWTMELLKRLDQPVGPGVLDKPIFATSDAEHPAEKTSDPALLKELNAGKYDLLFQGAPDKPSDLYRAAQKPPPLPAVELKSSSPIAPEVFLLPKYPVLAKMAHVEGTVSLKIEVDANGAVTKFDVVSGHPLLRVGMKESMSAWRFPRIAVSQKIEATVQFTLNCPSHANQKSPTN